MRIGLTYELKSDSIYQNLGDEAIAEYGDTLTIDAIQKALEEQGYQVERIGHIQQLVRALADGKRWDLVFNYAIGRHGRSREAQIPGLLDAYQIPYTFSDTETLAICLDKSLAKRIVMAHGVNTAPFRVIEQIEDLSSVELPFPLFAKPLAEGSSIGVYPQSCIHTSEDLEKVCLNLLQQYQQSVLIETYLPQREFTIGIIGTGSRARVLGVVELTPLAEKGAYTFTTKKHSLERMHYQLVTDSEAQAAGDAALRAYRVLGCRDAARADFRSDSQGVPHFLEMNPLAGLQPLDSDLVVLCGLIGMPYGEMIKQIMKSAHERL